MDLLTHLHADPKLAPLKYRVSAALIDFLVLWLLSFGMGYFFGDYYVTDDSIGYNITGWPGLLLFLLEVGLIPVQEGLTGRTIGKRIVQIKVVKEDYSDISVSRSIARHLFDIVDLILLIGLLIAAATPKKQRIGDLVAKTVVVIG